MSNQLLKSFLAAAAERDGVTRLVPAAPKRPGWSRAVKVGDSLTVRDEYMTRGGQQGEVLSINDEGVGLDFYCDIEGDQDGAPSQEFWKWEEIDPARLPASAQQAI